MAFNKHEDGYAAVWKGKTEKAPATAVGEKCPSVVVSLLLGMWLQRKGRGITGDELQKGRYQYREDHNIRELPLTVFAKCIGRIGKERKEQNIPF